MPNHEPTAENRQRVESYSAVGIPQDDIARVLGIHPMTLRKYYRDELDNAATKANAAVGGKLYKKAMDGDTTALIWWTKARMRWSEKREAESDAPEPVTAITYQAVDASVVPDDADDGADADGETVADA